MIRLDPREDGCLLIIFGKGTLTLQGLYHPDIPMVRLAIRELKEPGEIGKKHEFREDEFSDTPEVNLQFSSVAAIDHMLEKLNELKQSFKEKYNARSQPETK